MDISVCSYLSIRSYKFAVHPCDPIVYSYNVCPCSFFKAGAGSVASERRIATIA